MITAIQFIFMITLAVGILGTIGGSDKEEKNRMLALSIAAMTAIICLRIVEGTL